MMKAIQLFLLVILPFSIVAQNRYDVVIDELMADPTPQVGLPNNEWIELKNTTGTPINLQNWRIGDATGQSGPLPNFLLQPDSFVVICSSGSLSAMQAFGTALSVTSFPSLDNDGDQIFLKSASGKLIHAVAYSSSWYQNESKKDGGWTLEMIDTKNPCSGMSNWKVSIAAKGGTPSRKNSVDATNPDLSGPKLKRAYGQDSITVVLVFDEPLDSLKAATVNNYTIDGGMTIASAICLAPLFDKVQLKLTSPMLENAVYNITGSNITDCKGNLVGAGNKARVGWASAVSPFDVVINEILFNPRSNGFDYVEFYNRSKKIIDASKLSVANRSSTGTISSIKPLSTTPFYVFPQDYIVITEDLASLQVNYLVKKPDAVVELSLLPSYPDDKGDVVLLDVQGNVVDEVVYSEDWHFKLIDNPEGISLEKIDPAAASQDRDNWHSAASTAGYGTPTYQNSQFKLAQVIEASFEVFPKVFSPDNDGRDDVATLQYKLAETGYVANVRIFDAEGRMVRILVRNGTLGLNGYWNWDGLDDKGQRLPVGAYVISSEIFNLKGKARNFKNVVVLARRFQ